MIRRLSQICGPAFLVKVFSFTAATPSLRTPAPIKSRALPGSGIGTPGKLLREAIYGAVEDSPRQAALDALASDAPIIKALDAGADATHIPEIFRSVESKVLTFAQEAKKNVGHVQRVG